MSQLVIQPMQWNSLRDIDDVNPIDENDAACLEEIRQVLEKHNSLDRFGVSLMHKHFNLAEGEVLLETTDLEKREHWVRPVKRADLTAAGIQARTTVIVFDSTGYTQQCICAEDGSGHSGGHQKIPG